MMNPRFNTHRILQFLHPEKNSSSDGPSAINVHQPIIQQDEKNIFVMLLRTLKMKGAELVEQAEPNIPLLGIFAFIGYFVFYVIWKYLFPQPYENLALRAVEAILATPLVLYKFLKPPWRKFFPLYFLTASTMMMPFFFFFMMLQNEWSTVWILSTVAGLLLLAIIVNNGTIVSIISIIGYGFAYLAFLALHGWLPYTQLDYTYLPIFLFTIVGSLAATYRKRFSRKSQLSLVKSLSENIAREIKDPLNTIITTIDDIKTILPESIIDDQSGSSVMMPQSGLITLHKTIDLGSETILKSNKIIDPILASLTGERIDCRYFRRHAARETIHAAISSYAFEKHDVKEMICIDTTHDFFYLGDRDLFIQSLFKLLKNALDHCQKPDFRIEISTGITEKGNCIVVRDTRPAIPADELELLFRQFHTYRETDETETGLWFCQSIAESFGGSISCKSEINEWTEFIINLPPYESTTVDKIKQKLLGQKRVLVVDDQESNRIMLCSCLKELNCPADQAENGQTALEKAGKTRYDMILMDIEMPLLNGDETARRLRAGLDIDNSLGTHYMDIPIIGVTALPEKEARFRISRAGMDGYVLKPIGSREIKQLVERYFFTLESENTTPKPLLSITGARVLLVDDQEITREFHKALLGAVGCRIIETTEIREALSVLEQQTIDIVLLAMEKPIVTCIEAAADIRNGKSFRRFKRFRSIPIIILSSHTDHESIKAIKKAGVNACLRRPAQKRVLVNTIATLLTLAEQQGQINSDDKAIAIPHRTDSHSMEILDESVIESLRDLGGQQLIDQLFVLFAQEAKQIIEELHAACKINDYEKATRLSDTLKGAAASIGASRIQAIATWVNETCQNRHCPEEDGWVEHLQDISRLTNEAFSKYLEDEK